MANFWLIGIVELLILFLAIGLVLRYYVHLHQQSAYQTGYYPPSSILSGCADYLAWFLYSICVYIAIFGYMLIHTFYNYLTIELLLGGLGTLWLTAILIGLIATLLFPKIRGDFFKGQVWRFLFFILFVFIGIFFVGYSIFITIPNSIVKVSSLVQGPQITEGIVQEKTSIATTRGGISYYVDIDNREFHVPNGTWWQSFTEGEKISYAFSDGWIDFAVEIFPPDEINLTLLGIIIIVDCILLWGLTIGASISGYYNYFFRKPTYAYRKPLDEATSYPATQIQSPYLQPEKTSKQYSCLPVLGLGIGLTAVLLLVWKRLFTKAAK